MNSYAELFLTFAKIGVMTFGGGYAMLPILQREVVESRKWATDPEIMDYYAIGQCTPGIIAVNVSTFIGKKLKGIPGAIVATLGMVFPSLVIITIIAAVISNFMDIAWVQNAFAGIRVCVCVFIFNAVVKLWKSAVIDIPTGVIFALVFIGSIFLNISPVIYVLAAGAAGIVISLLGGRKK
ncbi:MAG: chromate transporter [Parasporobacterium sp.]|nr:chromate transporter [Parasporobacterium sp.]